jgi:hypothetical protein
MRRGDGWMPSKSRDTDEPRRVGVRAFNKAKTFFNENDMIFEKVDLESDIGIDALLTFSRRGPDIGRFINVQIKGGKKYKRATHIDEFYRRYRGMASLRSTDWHLWSDVHPSVGYEGHHIVDVDARLRAIWHNARPTYVVVQDPDDNELYFGNLTRMVDMQPLDQELAAAYAQMHMPNDGSVFHRYLAGVHRRIARLPPEQVEEHKTWMPLYQDLRLTPDGLDRFMEYALADARQPLPDRRSGSGEIATTARYPDGTVGPSLEALEARKRLGLG